jgi:redox-sensitive bicupin YhaK (pirin superfamily)
MPAVTPDDLLALPRLPRPGPGSPERPVLAVLDAPTFLEGEGFRVRRATAGLDLRLTDPFLLLDHLGAVEYAPGEARGAPDHPHRGFETVTYILDGELVHRDSHGGGGIITDGATQWMTAGAGIVHSEMPSERIVVRGGLFHGTQLWVNLPRRLKWTPPRYQDIEARSVALAASHDAGAVVRVIAGELGGIRGPGATWTPIAYVHATVAPGARLELAWPPEFNTLAYALAGRGAVGSGAESGGVASGGVGSGLGGASAPFGEGQLAIFGLGDHLVVSAAARQESRAPALEVLLLGGRPIREPVAWYGPFVMSTRAEILQAIEDYRAGRMGVIPAEASRTRFEKESHPPHV